METALIRLGITFGLSLAFGLQRQFSNKPIGFGTFTFVSIGSAALALTAVTVDPDTPLPLIGAIVTGIGFLGAGALIKTSDKIFGFTSAAGIWLFAIIGLTVGLGHYLTAGGLYAAVWIIVAIDAWLERRGLGLYQKRVTITLSRPCTKTEIKRIIGAKKYKTLGIGFDKDAGRYTFSLIVEHKKSMLDELPGLLADNRDVVEFDMV